MDTTEQRSQACCLHALEIYQDIQRRRWKIYAHTNLKKTVMGGIVFIIGSKTNIVRDLEEKFKIIKIV